MSFEIESEPVEQVFFPNIESEPVEEVFFPKLAKNLSWFNQEIGCEDANADVFQIAFMMRLG
ncbi:hypothetical protein NG798_15750 [Ancylothrix sp. C2]|nr:hypothetical protein [Ancylothrix sp. D3o]